MTFLARASKYLRDVFPDARKLADEFKAVARDERTRALDWAYWYQAQNGTALAYKLAAGIRSGKPAPEIGKTIDHSIPPVTFEDFATANDLTIEISERTPIAGFARLPRYFASFQSTDAMEPGVLVGIYGNGETKEEAIEDYKRQLIGRRLAINADWKELRREVQCPNEWKPEP